MMLLLDFAIACVDCTGGNKNKKPTETGSITILTESTSRSINTISASSKFMYIYLQNCFIRILYHLSEQIVVIHTKSVHKSSYLIEHLVAVVFLREIRTYQSEFCYKK